MPKRISKPMDINQAAFQMVRRSTGTADPPKVTASEVSRVMAAMGRKGGKIGGTKRAANMTPEERSKSASEAASARWIKYRQEHGEKA